MSDTPIDRLNAALSDRYRIDRELGEGGMANVFLAHDRKHERQVALKVLKPELAAVVGGERFVVGRFVGSDGDDDGGAPVAVLVNNFVEELKARLGR